MHGEVITAAKKLYPITGLDLTSLKNILFRMRFIKRAKQQEALLNDFIESMTKLGHSEIFAQKPYMLGLLEWPYMHNQWDLHQRIQTILAHYKLLPKLPEFLNVADAKPKTIVDLNYVSEGASIALDRAIWFAREGEVVLNLFKGNQRVKSIAFTLNVLNNELVIYVGAIQGIHADDDSLGLFKSLTKDFEGLRPRSLVIELLRMVAENIGAKKILAISDENRHHRHPYFANTHKNTLKTGYDSIWLDHEGVKLENGFFEIPVAKHRRDIAEVSSNKRAMYRRRYQMLDKIEANVSKLKCFVYFAALSQLELWSSTMETIEILA